MALFRAQIAYLRAATRDVAYGTNVRALLSTAGADTNFTITFTSTTAATQTMQPYTNISNNTTDNRTTHGWGFNQNEASTDGVGSTSTRKRIIPAGTWSFSNSLAGNAPPLLDSYTVTLEYSVYRVATNGGARSLLFSFSGSGVSRDAAGTFTYTATSPSQPLYTLEPNETLHLAIRVTSAATSALLGSTANTVITVNGATSGSQTMTLPSPGMRSLFFDNSTATGSGVGTESIYTRKDTYTATGEGVGVISRLQELFREFEGIGEGVGVISRLQELFREFEGIGEGVGTESILVRKDTITGVGEGAGVISRKLELFRTFLSVGEGAGTESILVKKDTISAIGEGDGDLARAVVFVRDFLATGAGDGDLTKAVIFVLDFNATGKATIKARIALDWDDLPDSGGGGGTIINVYRPLFVFDD